MSDQVGPDRTCQTHKVAYEREWVSGMSKSVEFCPECKKERDEYIQSLFKEVPKP